MNRDQEHQALRLLVATFEVVNHRFTWASSRGADLDLAEAWQSVQDNFKADEVAVETVDLILKEARAAFREM